MVDELSFPYSAFRLDVFLTESPEFAYPGCAIGILTALLKSILIRLLRSCELNLPVGDDLAAFAWNVIMPLILLLRSLYSVFLIELISPRTRLSLSDNKTSPLEHPFNFLVNYRWSTSFRLVTLLFLMLLSKIVFLLKAFVGLSLSFSNSSSSSYLDSSVIIPLMRFSIIS